MDRRRVITTGLALAAGAVGAPMLNLGRVLLAATGPEVSTRAIDLVGSSTVVDMLGLMTLDWPKLSRWYRRPDTFQTADFRSLEATGVDIYHSAVETDHPDPDKGARWWLHRWRSFVASQPCFLSRVDDVSDLIRLPMAGKIGLLLGFQNSTHFRTVADVGRYRQLGQRVSQLTYNDRNRIGSGCLVADHGLTGFGAEIIAEMNRTGMVVDISHCGDRTSLEALLSSRRPVLITHANPRALVPGQPRNKPDEIIRRMAGTGGVMGINLVRGFVGHGSPSIDDVLDHFDHVARLVGVEHVGLGTDVSADALHLASASARRPYDIRGLDPQARIFQIAGGLLGRGWRDRDVALVLGGNFLRALADVWADEPWQPLPDPRALDRDPFCPPPLPPRPPVLSGRPAE